MKIYQLREKANNLPLLPGVYIMKDAEGTIIYVGKAKKLKNRVTSYFRGSHLPKVEAMVEKVDDFEFITVNSEFEALILENKLIKQYQPHYNILLKDDKGYPYIQINRSTEYPTMAIVSKILNDKDEWYGPFGGRDVTRDIINSIYQALKLPTCTRHFPECIGKERACLNYSLGICEGWCLKNNNEEYVRRFNQAVMILKGNSQELIDFLTEKMFEASDNEKFELAAVYRDRIKSINGLNNKQRVTKKNYSKYFQVSKSEDNADKKNKSIVTLDKLKKMLNLPSFPERIEAYDISNLGDSGIVAGMTVFVNGKPLKSDYRKFRINGLKTSDDYASMFQCLERRFNRYTDNDPKFNKLPDLLLIDGGQTHAQTAENVLLLFNISIPVFGMVKDSHHKTRALINSRGEEVDISSDISLFSLIGSIQEETHRFAIEYQKVLRYENFGSELDLISGVGNVRKAALLKQFKTVKAIKSANIDQLSAVVPKNTAQQIYKYFHGDKDEGNIR